jgi:hypothetical protein
VRGPGGKEFLEFDLARLVGLVRQAGVNQGLLHDLARTRTASTPGYARNDTGHGVASVPVIGRRSPHR